MPAWTLPREIRAPKNPGALTDLVPLLDRLEAAFGTRRLAELLGVSCNTLSSWKKRREIGSDFATRVMDLHDVLVRALRVYQPQVAMDWLVGHEPFLDGARPIDVLVLRGSAPVIGALLAIEAAAYA
jgi:uncharacterized protein (DUF2384 family)